ncbi:DNA nucleotidylexotransferase isoform X2 [Oryzias melastigma]|uniref:DNA nucleotidylexotransferase isoform X2 n=1 Tax=Oryzias melastigma TaxID=30732 RepID=UPI000CF7ED43|nr:DNA nucleotidylexotransferase isoform X2 [Oryzias melastigma]
MHVLDISWFTDSMKEKRPVAVETKHLIQDAFEVLAENYEFNGMEGQCLAFRRAASVLKSLSWEVRSSERVHELPCLGETMEELVEEILQYGRSFEVNKILSDERYQTLKLFTSVFGVGLKTAEKWYRRGLRTFPDVLEEPSIHLNRMQQSGFLHYGDISRAVSKAEAQALGSIIDEAVHAITPDGTLTLTGGFRRGKDFGHDVDFIVTTPERGQEERLLTSIIQHLKQQGILLFSDYQSSSFDMSKLPSHRFEAMDHFAKCFLILRLEGREVEGGLCRAEGDSRDWRAVRVDLVSPPPDRFAFTLLGWTGSRQFERDLRRFARLERRMLLDNHALFDKTKQWEMQLVTESFHIQETYSSDSSADSCGILQLKKEFLAATTEKDIFAHLGLEYIEPWQRNA